MQPLSDALTSSNAPDCSGIKGMTLYCDHPSDIAFFWPHTHLPGISGLALEKAVFYILLLSVLSPATFDFL
jgi:hypothetical protein